MQEKTLRQFETLYTTAKTIAHQLNYDPVLEPIGYPIHRENNHNFPEKNSCDLLAQFNWELYDNLDGSSPINPHYPPYYCKKVADYLFEAIVWVSEYHAWLVIQKQLTATVYFKQIHTLQAGMELRQEFDSAKIAQIQTWETIIFRDEVQRFWQQVEELFKLR